MKKVVRDAPEKDMGLGQRERVRETNITIKVFMQYMVSIEYWHICTKQNNNRRRNRFWNRASSRDVGSSPGSELDM